jgi:hypothetical protein
MAGMSASDADFEIEIEPGRVPPPHTPAPDWITMSAFSAAAQKLHKVLGMHVNRDRGDGIVWPSTRSLAALMGYSRGDKISTLLKELAAGKAIEIRRRGVPCRNVYVWHQLPPEGYTGPVTLKDWYSRNRPLLDQMRKAEQARRKARRKTSAKAQVNPDTPDPGGTQADPGCPPDGGDQAHPDSGDPDTPDPGREQEEEEQEEKNPPPTPHDEPAAPDDGEAATAEGEEPEDHIQTRIDDAVVEVRKLRPGWSPPRVVKVLRAALGEGRDPAVVFAAVLLVAADPATKHPSRLNQDGDWWPAAERAVRRPPPAPPRVSTVWCDRHGHRYPAGEDCGLCMAEARNGGYGTSDGPGGASVIDLSDAEWARLPAATRARYAAARSGS